MFLWKHDTVVNKLEGLTGFALPSEFIPNLAAFPSSTRVAELHAMLTSPDKQPQPPNCLQASPLVSCSLFYP